MAVGGQAVTATQEGLISTAKAPEIKNWNNQT